MLNSVPLSKTFRLSFQVDGKTADAEDIREFLVCIGAWAQSVEEVTEQGLSFSVYCADPAYAEQVAKHLKKRFARIALRQEVHKPQDWIHSWKDSFRPFRLTKKVDVVPFDHMPCYRCKAGRSAIFIDTSIAFGTGMHETTQFMANFIEGKAQQLGRFCDVGCGTGILSILALVSGAQNVYAFDYDREALRIAKSNFVLNKCTDYHCEFGDIYKLDGIGRFDFVAANLVTDDLIKARRQLLKLVKPGKYLAVSGISCENYQRFREAFRTLHLRCLRVLRGKKWTAILFKRM